MIHKSGKNRVRKYTAFQQTAKDFGIPFDFHFPFILKETSIVSNDKPKALNDVLFAPGYLK